MSNQQTGAWQTATSRQRNSSSRTPQNRSGTASPSQNSPAHPAPRQEPARSQPPVNNVWSQRSSSATGQAKTPDTVTGQDSDHQPLNGFNAGEVKSFLNKDLVGGVAAYKPTEASGGQRNSGGAWGMKPGNMANNQPFFTQLAKQIATLEGGG